MPDVIETTRRGRQHGDDLHAERRPDCPGAAQPAATTIGTASISWRGKRTRSRGGNRHGQRDRHVPAALRLRRHHGARAERRRPAEPQLRLHVHRDNDRHLLHRCRQLQQRRYRWPIWRRGHAGQQALLRHPDGRRRDRYRTPPGAQHPARLRRSPTASGKAPPPIPSSGYNISTFSQVTAAEMAAIQAVLQLWAESPISPSRR